MYHVIIGVLITTAAPIKVRTGRRIDKGACSMKYVVILAAFVGLMSQSSSAQKRGFPPTYPPPTRMPPPPQNQFEAPGRIPPPHIIPHAQPPDFPQEDLPEPKDTPRTPGIVND